jgi:hypothetical protein
MNTQVKTMTNGIKGFLIRAKDRTKPTIAQDHGLEHHFESPQKIRRSSKIAPIHEQEARQRYWILRRDIEMNIDNCLTKLGGDAEERELLKQDRNVDAYIAELQKKFLNKINPKSNNNKSEKVLKLLGYYKILLRYENVDCNKLNNVSMLWKDLTFIRTRMLSEGIIDSDKLPYQLDFCRSEAEHIGAENDPEVKSMMAQAAENLGLQNASSRNNRQAIRLIISLMVKLNDMRIRKLTEQVHKKKTYMTLFSILIALSLLLFFFNDHLMFGAKKEVISNQKVNAIALDPVKIQANKSVQPFKLIFVLWNWCVSKVEFLLNLIVSTPTIFIFFAGLTGGFFSALMKFKPNKQLPGDELYIRWYRLTKPFIGAFGSMVIFVIITTGLFTMESISEAIQNGIVSNPISGAGFTFGFLTGFTERLILPKMN